MDQLLNLTDYTVAEQAVFITGCALWAVVYVIYIRNHRRYGFIEMPVIAAASNFAWEFLWAFRFHTDMGRLLQWGYQLWFLLDIYIFAMVVRDGVDQVGQPRFRAVYRPLIITVMLAWGVGYYFFTAEGYDTPTGLTSGLIANVVISGLYPYMLLGRKSLREVSTEIAWLKMLGTGLITLFTFMHFESAYFIKTLGVVVLVLDLWYIYLLASRRREAQSGELAGATL